MRRLDVDVAATVVEGIGKGCEQAGCALVGGETAEMPGMYGAEDYDLAGFCVGVVEKGKILDGSAVRPGDKLLGLESSGPHSNGYSLIRKILERSNRDESLDGRPLTDWLMEPTRIYVRTLLRLMSTLPVHALAHITGGGITENLPRVLPEGLSAKIDLAAWTRSPLFYWLRENGTVEETEMLRTFNCGIGMIVCVAPEDESLALDTLRASGESAHTIGVVVPHPGTPVVQYSNRF